MKTLARILGWGVYPAIFALVTGHVAGYFRDDMIAGYIVGGVVFLVALIGSLAAAAMANNKPSSTAENRPDGRTLDDGSSTKAEEACEAAEAALSAMEVELEAAKTAEAKLATDLKAAQEEAVEKTAEIQELATQVAGHKSLLTAKQAELDAVKTELVTAKAVAAAERQGLEAQLALLKELHSKTEKANP